MVIYDFEKRQAGLKYFITILIVAVSLACLSQDVSKIPKKYVKQFELALHKYKNKDYSAALVAINQLIEKDNELLEALLLKADVLHEMNRTEPELDCLNQILEIDSINYPKVYFVRGVAEKRLGDYRRAKNSFLRFVEHAGNLPAKIEQARKNILSCDFAISQIENPVVFEPSDLGDSINSEFDEYWPSLSLDGNTLVFTRLIPSVDSLIGRQFFQEDFFMSNCENGIWTIAQPLTAINTPNNEGAQAISPDAGLLFFTACSRRDTWGGCDLYFSRKNGSDWSIPVNAGQPVNSTGWESQPSISANNEYLYFVSNRKGGKGGMDIWRCRMLSMNGERIHWGKAENLGDSINTSGNEMSPFIHPDGQTLYFASDYWPGMGENDIFYSKMEADSSWSKPRNVGYPINTYHDERGMVVDASGETAYYSSNKAGQGMDIYSFEMPESIRPIPVTYFKGVVTDAKRNIALIARVELIDIDYPEKIVGMQSDENGEFLMGLPLGQNYMMNVSAPGYLFYSEHFGLTDVNKATAPYLQEIRLSPIEKGSVTVLRNVFFDTGSYELLPESITELLKLKEFLLQNPSIKIEIGGHTDNVGADVYNNELSSKRAKSVYDFLIQNKIDKARLTYRGYGLSSPLKSNETAEGRALNRRTEFRILE